MLTFYTHTMNIKNCSMAVKKPLIESIISVIFKQIRIRFSVQIALFITARCLIQPFLSPVLYFFGLNGCGCYWTQQLARYSDDCIWTVFEATPSKIVTLIVTVRLGRLFHIKKNDDHGLYRLRIYNKIAGWIKIWDLFNKNVGYWILLTLRVFFTYSNDMN